MRVKQAVILEGFENSDYEFEYVPSPNRIHDCRYVYQGIIRREVLSFQESHHGKRPGI